MRGACTQGMPAPACASPAGTVRGPPPLARGPPALLSAGLRRTQAQQLRHVHGRLACRDSVCVCVCVCARTFNSTRGYDARVYVVRQSQEAERGTQKDRQQQLQPPGKAAYPGRTASFRHKQVSDTSEEKTWCGL